MLSDAVSLSLTALTPRVDACELCLTPHEAVRSVVVVRHTRGGTLDLVACDRCAAAVRRLLAAAGGQPYITAGHHETRPDAPSSTEPALTDVVGSPELIHEYVDPVRTADGKVFNVRAYGQARSDGTWVGWLAFAAADGSLRRTSRETTQSSRDHLAYWAAGLQPSYFDGALLRASGT